MTLKSPARRLGIASTSAAFPFGWKKGCGCSSWFLFARVRMAESAPLIFCPFLAKTLAEAFHFGSHILIHRC